MRDRDRVVSTGLTSRRPAARSYSLPVNSLHARVAVNDLILFSPSFTKITPSLVHVSVIFPSRFRLRASHAIVARALVMSSLMNSLLPFSFRAFFIIARFMLCVVNRTITSRGVPRSSDLFPTRCDRTTSWSATCTSSLRAASSLTRSSVSSCIASGRPRIRRVLRREYRLTVERASLSETLKSDLC